MKIDRVILFALIGLAAAFLPSGAAAHSSGGLADGFASGAMHPVLGLDHLVAMVAVGLWGAQLGRPLVVALPLAFPMMMALGGVLGMAGLSLPGVEIGIAGSAIVLGLAVLAAWRAPEIVAVALVAAFAIFHGMAHGLELPEAAAPIAYGAGFLVATGLLHLAGIAIGMLHDTPAPGPFAVRIAGGVVVLVGAVFMAQALGIF